MAQIAIVTWKLSKGFYEVAFLDENDNPLKERYVAETTETLKRGDLVKIKQASSKDEKLTRLAYLIPVASFVLGFFTKSSLPMNERLITGLLLAIPGYMLAWFIDRRARLRRRLDYRVLSVVKKAPDFFD